jgi:hypothetical protein
MSRRFRIALSLLALSTCLTSGSEGKAVEFKTAILRNEIIWQSDYYEAYRIAQRDKKLLLIYFDPHPPIRTTEMATGITDDAIDRTLAATEDRERLADYVFARLPLDVTIAEDKKLVRLVDHPAFADIRNGGGLAIIDLAHPNTPYYTFVVSVLPLTNGKYYRFHPEYVPVLLDLPEGTLTQRTMIFAVRIHPESPASTRSKESPVLSDEASSHSRYQAQIGVQGHHQWASRFQRIISRLLGRGTPALPKEIVAESWPNQNLIDSCIDCVDSWRQSSGHWAAVKSPHDSYGYDIERGSNGIWYATGIFAN